MLTARALSFARRYNSTDAQDLQDRIGNAEHRIYTRRVKAKMARRAAARKGRRHA